jgi:putative ABC transport system substrate-binding protein
MSLRREFLVALGGAIVCPVAARAQQKAMPMIGFLHGLSADRSTAVLTAFREGLREGGYVEGQNVVIEYRWADGTYDQLPALAADLVARKADVIMTGGGTPSAVAAKQATSTIPIVFTSVSDPVGLGLIANWARPGGNVTGISAISRELLPKRLELLSELVSKARIIALLVNPNFPNWEQQIKDAQQAANTKGAQLHTVKASTESELDAAFTAVSGLHADALVVATDPFFYDQRQKLAALASRHGIPAIYELDGYVAAGGLISYGISLAGVYRQAAAYVARVLAGAKPADLPVEQPTRFQLVINLKVAKALGLTVPQSILGRADEVIE